MVDTLGGMDLTLDLIKKRLGVNPSEDLKLVYYPHKRSFFEQIIKNIAIFDKNVTDVLREELFIQRYQAQPLALMPFLLMIK